MKRNEYIKVSQVLDSQTSNLLYEYIKTTVQRYEKLKEVLSTTDIEDKLQEVLLEEKPAIGLWGGEYTTPSMGFAKYGGLLTDTLMVVLKSTIERETNLKLIPTYSFFRLYRKGDSLPKHNDRPQCEISVSLCVGWKGEQQWPLFLEGNPILLDVGDLAIYRGVEAEHWRDPLEGEEQAQIFLHYNDIDGPYGETNLYDGRPFIGWPRGIIKDENTK